MGIGGTNVLVRFLSDASSLMAGIGQAEAGLRGFATRVQTLGATMTGFGTKMTIFGTVPILGLGVATAKAAVDFDKSMRFVNTIAHKAGDEYEQMVEEVKRLSVEVPQSATTLAMAVYNIMSAGFSKFEDAMQLAEVSARMAVAGMTDADIAAKALTTVMNSYGSAIEEADHISDVLFKGVERGVFRFEDLAGALGNVVGMAAQAGIPLEELIAALETTTKAGLDVKKATTGLNYVFLNMIKQTELQKKAVDLLSKASGVDLVSSFSASGLQAKGLAGVLTDVMAAIEGAGVSVEQLKDMTEEEYEAMAQASIGTGEMMESITQLFPSVLALRSVFGLTRGELTEFAADLAATADAGGAAGKAFDAAMESTSMQFDMFKSRLTRLLIEFGDRFLPTINRGMDYLGNLFDKVAALDEGTKDLIIRIALVTAAAGPALIVAGQATTALGGLIGIVGQLGGGLMSLGGGFAGAATSAGGLLGFVRMLGSRLLMILGPIGLILFLLMAIGGNIQDMEGGFSSFMAKVKEVLSGLLSTIMALLSKLLTALTPLMDAAAEILNMILGPLIQYAKAVIEVLTEVLRIILPPLLDLLKAIGGYLMLVLKSQLSILMAILRPLGGILIKLVEGVLAPLLVALGELISVVTEIAGEVLGTLTALLIKLIEPLMELVDSLLGPLITLFQAWLKIALPLMELGLIPLKTVLFLLEPPLNLIITLIEHIIKAFTWLVDKILGPVADAIGWVVDKIGGFFKTIGDWLPFSPAKKGPLSKPVHWDYITEGLVPALDKAEKDISKFNAAKLEKIPLDEDLPGKFAKLNDLMDGANRKIDILVGGFKRLADMVAGPVMTSLEKANVVVTGVAEKVTNALAVIPTEIRKGIESTLAGAVEMIEVTVNWSAFAQGLDEALVAVERRVVEVARVLRESLSDAFNIEPLLDQLRTSVTGDQVRVPVAVDAGAGTAGTVTGETAFGPLGHIAVIALDEEGYQYLNEQLEVHRAFEKRRRGEVG
ncbi:phage tail tape measure protein [Chloroflexota bacterium]